MKTGHRLHHRATAPTARSAKALLERRGIAYEEINLAKDPDGRAELARRTGMVTFPQIMIGGEPIGGFDELLAADRAGPLAELLAEPSAAGPASSRRRLTHDAAAAGAAGSARTRRSRARRRRSCGSCVPQRGHGSPSRRWTRKRSWKEPRAPSRWRKSSIVAPLASIPAAQRLLDRVAQRASCAARQPPAGRSGWMPARNSASSA